MRSPSSFDSQLMGTPGGLATLDDNGRLVQRDGLGTKHATTVVVGTTKAGHTEDDVDFLCTGINDEVQINQAIQSTTGYGGQVVVLEGDYFIHAPIHLDKPRITLSGMGESTALFRKFYGNITVESGALIYISADHCRVQNMRITGDEQTLATGYANGISAKASYLHIDSVTFHYNRHAIYIESGDFNYITNCIVFNSHVGIIVDAYSFVSNNLVRQANSNAIVCNGGYGTISSNFIQYTEYGIRMVDAGISSVTGNSLHFVTETNIRWEGNTRYSTISGNNAVSGKRGLHFADGGSNMVVVGNNFANNSVAGMENVSTTSNTVSGNRT